jgi:eukaryotic-like serine/threonine-protein kinase
MNTDRNLLFGLLALQTELIDSARLLAVCTLVAARKEGELGQLLVDLGWITAADRADVEHLLQRKLPQLNEQLAQLNKQLAKFRSDQAETPGRSLVSTAEYPAGTGERYTLLSVHATGGIGKIWHARDNQLSRDVAVKELRAEKAADPVLRARFLREACVTGQLEHPGIVPVYELWHDSADARAFYSMRFIKGRTLRQTVSVHHEEGPASPSAPVDFLTLINAFLTVCNGCVRSFARHHPPRPQG